MIPSKVGDESRFPRGEIKPGGNQDFEASELIARMENVPFSRWHTKARVVVGTATFFDAFTALSLAFTLPVLIQLWHITARQVGILIAASYIGQLFGALLFGWLAEEYGRIRSVTAAVAIMTVMSFGCAMAGNFPGLLVCRFIQGIGVGGEMPVAAAYVNELSKAHGRGRFFLLYELIFPIGSMFTGQLGAWLVPTVGWKSMFLVGAVPGLLITLLVARLPESPRWLISHRRLPEAESIIEQIEASTERRITETITPSGAALNPTPAFQHPQRTRWREVLSPFYRGRTLIAWTLWASSYFIANSLNNWLPSLYNTVYHLSLRQSLRAASMTNALQVVVLFACALSIDRIGRKKWTFVSFLVAGTVLSILGFGGTPGVRSIMILGTLTYGIVGSTNGVLYLYTPEIYPTRMRAIGTGLATSWLRLASAVGPALVGVLVTTRGVGSVFILFAGVTVVGALAASRMIETRGRRLEEIAP